jgi:hypothetical protein
MANRSVDRIRNRGNKDDPVIFWSYSTESQEQPEVTYELTGDYPNDWHEETTYADADIE